LIMAPTYEQAQAILRCPITKQSLRLLKLQEMKPLNERIAKGELTHNDGTPVKASIQAGFITEDGQFVYLVLEGIILLLEYLAIPVAGQNGTAPAGLRAEKKVLQDFYDSIGWQKNEKAGTSFVDALKWEDLRPVSREYIHNCHIRVNRYIKNQGRYLLDAGSGPIQYPEYLSYSDGYDFRICVDLSFLALKEAQKKLGDKGIYILGDVTNIPLQDNVVEGAVSLHVIYHVPKDEQVSVFRELHRVVKPGCSAAVVYAWPHPKMMRLWMLPRRIKVYLRIGIRDLKAWVKKILHWEKRRKAVPAQSVPQAPYYFAHDQAYFESNFTGMEFEIKVWRSVGVPFLRTYIHPRLFGAAILRSLYRKEENNPSLYGRIGQYPLIVIRKQ
jgi:ubiquinone/menaquinone biosynthesis C-methylase UbiE